MRRTPGSITLKVQKRLYAAIVSALPALPGPASRLLPPAGAGFLGLRLSDHHGDRAGVRVSEPAAGTRSRSTWWTSPGAAEIKAAVEAHNASLEAAKKAGKPRLNVPSIELHEASDGRGIEAAEDRPDAAGHRAARSQNRATYRYDPTRPEASAARQVVDDVLAARRRPHRPAFHERRLRQRAGLALHRFSDPRPDRAQRHGRRALGHRLPGGELPDRQASQAVRRHSDAPARFPARASRRPTDLRAPRPDRAPLARER